MSAHTPEPWYTSSTTAGDVWIYARGAPVVEPIRSLFRLFRLRGQDEWRLGDARWKRKEADARRIVACVNALAGVDDPEAFVRRARAAGVEG